MLSLNRFNPRKTGQQSLQSLRRLIQRTYRSVSAYRDMGETIRNRVREFSSFEDLVGLPVLTRDSLASVGLGRFLCDGACRERLQVATTTGTTGHPVSVSMSSWESHFRKFTLVDVFRRYVKHRLPLRITDIGVEHKQKRKDLFQRAG